MLSSKDLCDATLAHEIRTLAGPQRRQLLNDFWPETKFSRPAFDGASSDAILDHVADELEQIRHHEEHFAAQSLGSVFTILPVIKASISVPYRELVCKVRDRLSDTTECAIHCLIELSVRIWLTMNVRSQNMFMRPMSAGDELLDWTGDVSLERLLKDRFGRHARRLQDHDAAKFDSAFTATYLTSNCGLSLRWTDDITNHLSFDSKNCILTVYRHKACLLSHLANRQGCPIRADVLEEMLDTMDLLFPPLMHATKALLRKEHQESIFSLGCHRSHRLLELEHYKYFGHALSELMHAFDKTPRTWKQLAFDRRNKLEWSAFWVTVMVGLLTVISIPCNIIQATYSVKSYHVALAQGNDGLGGTGQRSGLRRCA
jgi:hypothetical protein